MGEASTVVLTSTSLVVDVPETAVEAGPSQCLYRSVSGHLCEYRTG